MNTEELKPNHESWLQNRKFSDIIQPVPARKPTPQGRGQNMTCDKKTLTLLFEKYIKKLRITPAWDVKLVFVEDSMWPKTGDFKIDCDDRKAVLLLNIAAPKQENLEEVIVHELMHIKMYPLDQVTESLITNCFEEGSPASNFAYQQFFTTLEQTVEELAEHSKISQKQIRDALKNTANKIDGIETK